MEKWQGEMGAGNGCECRHRPGACRIQLAASGANLVLTARRTERLTELAGGAGAAPRFRPRFASQTWRGHRRRGDFSLHAAEAPCD